jgi:hypothetical protein
VTTFSRTLYALQKQQLTAGVGRHIRILNLLSLEDYWKLQAIKLFLGAACNP